MAGEQHTNTSLQANGNTASWFQKLMRISIWEKGNMESKKEAAGKELPGHRDPTADAAIANVMREERRKENDRKGGEENA